MRLLRQRGVARGTLWLPERIVEQVVAEASNWAPRETGGALVGYALEGGLVITDVVGAGPSAVRTTSSFAPDSEYQLAEIARLYAESGRLHTYVGDWHSHPSSSPAYSATDKNALRTIAGDTGSRCDRPLMLILGDGYPWTAVAWRYQRSCSWDRIFAMEIREF